MQVEALLLQSKTDESSKEHTCYDETYFIIPRSRSSSACMQPVSLIYAIASLRRHHACVSVHNPKPRTLFRARIVAQPGECYPVGPFTRPRPR